MFVGNHFAVDMEVDEETIMRSTVVTNLFAKYNQILKLEELIEMFSEIDYLVEHLCTRHRFDQVNICHSSDTFDFEPDFYDHDQMNLVNVKDWYGVVFNDEENIPKQTAREYYNAISSHPYMVEVMK